MFKKNNMIQTSKIIKISCTGSLTCVILGSFASYPKIASAGILIEIRELADSVEVNIKGSLNTIGVSSLIGDSQGAAIVPSQGVIFFGGRDLTERNFYFPLLSNPSGLIFGTGGLSLATTSTINGSFSLSATGAFSNTGVPIIALPTSYRQGILIGSQVYKNASYQALGIKPGDYFSGFSRSFLSTKSDTDIIPDIEEGIRIRVEEGLQEVPIDPPIPPDFTTDPWEEDREPYEEIPDDEPASDPPMPTYIELEEPDVDLEKLLKIKIKIPGNERFRPKMSTDLPEPLTILGSFAAVTFGVFFKRKSNKI